MSHTRLEKRRSAREAYIRRVVRCIFGVLALGLLAGLPGTDALAQEGFNRGSDLAIDPLAADRLHWADGYVWADNPTATVYTPSTFYSFNRTGGAIDITRPAGTTGRYLVRFAGLSSFLSAKSTVKVTAYSSDSAYCKPVNPSLVNDVVEVRCFNASTNAPANAYYDVFITRNYTDLAFAHAHRPTGTNYAPLANSSWNPAGPMRVFKDGTGQYRVRFTGLGTGLTNGGDVQVSAAGTAKNHCKVAGWGGSPDMFVYVACFNGSGNPVNTKFNVLFLLPSDRLAYAWADQPTSASYTPSTIYSSNSGGGAVQITRGGTGSYVVTFNGLGVDLLDGGDVQVTAYGSGNEQCKVTSWGAESVGVRCFLPNGAPVDTYYTVLLGS